MGWKKSRKAEAVIADEMSMEEGLAAMGATLKKLIDKAGFDAANADLDSNFWNDKRVLVFSRLVAAYKLLDEIASNQIKSPDQQIYDISETDKALLDDYVRRHGGQP